MRLPTVHDGRSPLLQRPENQVRSVRGHVQVPCTGLLAGAPHTSKGQGARGTAATTAAPDVTPAGVAQAEAQGGQVRLAARARA